MNLLEAESIHVTRGERTTLSEVSLTLEAGTLTVVIGPNGSGKTTLLRALLSLVRSEGQVRLADMDAASMSRTEIARHVAYVPQHVGEAAGLTVRELVELGRLAHRGRPSAAEDGEAVSAAMQACSLGELLDRRVSRLSGGERRRVHLAVAFAQRAPLLFLDEPTAHLDPRASHEVLALVRGRCESGVAALVTLHDLDLAARVADRVVLLNQGKVVALGDPREVLTEARIAEVFGMHAEITERDEVLSLSLLGPCS